jgi:hypothetical protein
MNIQPVLQHHLCELPPKIEHRLGRCLLSTGPSHPGIDLCHGQEEGELTIGPPFGLPSTLQWNRSVATFVNVVHPMLPPVMPRERLGILEGLPLTIDLSPGMPCKRCSRVRRRTLGGLSAFQDSGSSGG